MKQSVFAIAALLLSSSLLANDINHHSSTKTANTTSSIDSDFTQKFNDDLKAIKKNEKDSAYYQQMNKRNFDCSTGVYGSSNCSYQPNNRFGRGGSTSYSSSRSVTTTTTTTTSKTDSGTPTTTTTTTKTSSSYSNFPKHDNQDDRAMQSIKDMEKNIVRMNQGESAK